MPVEVYEEVVNTKKPDDFVRWIRRRRKTVELGETVQPDLVASVVDRGYAPNLKEDEIRRLGRDPFLIAYALRDTENRCVVTNERSRPGRQRGNRHIPDVCAGLDIRCINMFRLIRDLDFRTGGSLISHQAATVERPAGIGLTGCLFIGATFLVQSNERAAGRFPPWTVGSAHYLRPMSRTSFRVSSSKPNPRPSTRRSSSCRVGSSAAWWASRNFSPQRSSAALPMRSKRSGGSARRSGTRRSPSRLWRFLECRVNSNRHEPCTRPRLHISLPA